MKNAKFIAVTTLLVLRVYGIVRGVNYYKRFFSDLYDVIRYDGIGGVVQIVNMLFLLLDLTLIIVFFASTGQYQDKVYKLLRYIFLINFFLHIPYTLYIYIDPESYFYRIDMLPRILQAVYQVINVVCVVLFLRAKPYTQPAAINLAEYELVSYTSMGHRFVHHLLDMVFVFPVFMFWTQVLPRIFSRNEYMMELLFVFIYLVYCFLSEAIFRQTLGKMATNSCVTSNGPELTGGRVLLRTFARLIPFDRLSFLFRANWHDKTTYTSVVYVDTWEKAFDESNPADTLATRK